MTIEELKSYPVPAWTTKTLWKRRIIRVPWNVESIILGSYKCADCNGGHDPLIVHHIDESRKLGKLNNDQKNLVPLCRKCHGLRHLTRNRTNVSELVRNYLRISGGFFYLGMHSDIARELGVSRERVRQICKTLGYKPLRKLIVRQDKKHCVVCGKESGSRKYCSNDCRKKYIKDRYWTQKPCKQCGKMISYLRSEEYKLPVFCSKRCQGISIGKTVGFKPGMSYRESGRDKILEIKGNFTISDISKEFDVSLQTARNWISELKNKDLIDNLEYTQGQASKKVYFIK